MKIYFLEDPPRCETKFSIKRIPANVRRAIEQLVVEHREALFAEWDAKVRDAQST